MSAAVGTEVEGVVLDEAAVELMEAAAMLELTADANAGGCVPAAGDTFDWEGALISYECFGAGGDLEDAAEELEDALDDLGDALGGGLDCATEHADDEDALAECLKWAGADCEDE